MIVIVGAYTVAGVSKFVGSDGEWIKNSPYFGIDVLEAATTG